MKQIFGFYSVNMETLQEMIYSLFERVMIFIFRVSSILTIKTKIIIASKLLFISVFKGIERCKTTLPCLLLDFFCNGDDYFFVICPLKISTFVDKNIFALLLQTIKCVLFILINSKKLNSKQAKQIPIEIYLDRLGYKPKVVKKNEIWYLSPLRVETTASFKVNKTLNAWYDYGIWEGGTIIDLVIHQFQTDISWALARLESAFGWGKLIIPCRAEAKRFLFQKTDNREITSIKPLSSPCLIAYLRRERRVDIVIAEKYLAEIHYKNGDRSYFALCFKNDSWGYETRSRDFKGSFSPKDITTIRGNKESKKVLIFEWFIDFISYLSYIQKSCLDENIIVLNSTSLVWKAIERIKELSPVELHFYLDNDNAWEKAKEIILEETGINSFSKNLYYSGFKDVNDFIRGIKKNNPRKGV